MSANSVKRRKISFLSGHGMLYYKKPEKIVVRLINMKKKKLTVVEAI